MEKHGGTISTATTPDSSTSALWQFYQDSYLVGKQEEMNLAYAIFLSYFEGFFNMP
jgi:hypothetical protein